jgi:putative colanic acid biosynthesis acetyltransferase WcaF
MDTVDLSRFDNSWYNPGRGCLCRALWHCANALLVQNLFNPSSRIRAILLRLFGAAIGSGVILKPGVNIKYPWNVQIGDHSWVGEKAWLDSLGSIKIGASVCISQGAYLCTGNHDWADPAFGLIVKGIVVEDGAWIGARATILPGVVIASHSIVCAGAVLARSTEAYTVYAGNPAVAVRERVVKEGASLAASAPVA